MTDTFNEKYYNSAYYSQFEAGFQNTTRSDHRRILDLMKFKEDSSVLEIGCGFGVLLSSIPAKRKIGIESNEYAITKCKEKGLEMLFVPQEGTKYDLESASLDAVVMNEVIEHFKDPAFVLREAHRLLKRGGKVAITTPAKSLLVRNLDVSHFSEMSVTELRQMVEKTGFKLLHHEVCGISFIDFCLRIFVFVPGRLARKIMLKSKGKSTPIDKMQNSFDESIIAKQLSKFRPNYLKLGTQQLIIAEKI